MSGFKTFRIGLHEISTSSEPIFLPDIGTFFNQDMSLALDMVDQLVESDVTTIKGEILHDPEICLRDSGNEIYWGRDSGTFRSEKYRSLIERKVVSLNAYEKIFMHCSDRSMNVVVSVYDFIGADFAKGIGVAAIKMASSNITHQPLIEHVASMGVPLILDTGHSTMEEIARAINWARDAGAENIVVEHSPLGPPNGVELHNLKFMITLGSAFGVPYGLSDHHAKEEMLYAASAMGAHIIEKGVCPDNLPDEQDAAHALPISCVKEVITKISNIYMALGDGVRDLPRDREKYRSRMGLVAKRDLTVGEQVSLANVTFAFPAIGIGAEYWEKVSGCVLGNPLKKGAVLRWRDLDDSTR